MNAKFHGIDVEVRKIVDDEAVIYPIPTQGLGLYHNAIKVPAAELEFDASEDDMDAIHNYIVAAEAGDRAALAYGDKWLGELPPAQITTLQELADAKERSFNRRYYNNPNGEPKFVYRSNR